MPAAIAEALLHFLWQGTVLGVLAYAFLRRAGSHAGARYALGIGTLTAMLLAPLVTTMWLLAESAGSAGAVVTGVATERADVVPVEWVLGLWTCGVIVCGVRLAGGWIVARRLATDAVTPVAREIDALATAVAGRLSVSRTFRVVESAIAVTPMMVGWLKPVVLLPTAAITGLSTRQLEAVIAHELAHIRRHDYLMNLLQSVVEALLFYHPAVWWVSRQVRDAREQCCDDLTVSVCDRLTYVSALSSVATLRAASPALAATGGSLRDRVERLLRPQPASTASVGWLAVIPIALVLISAAPVAVTPDAPVAPMVSVEQPVSVNPEPADQSPIEPIAAIANPQSPIPNPQFSNASPTLVPALPVALDFFMPATQAMTLQAPPTTGTRESGDAAARIAAGDAIRIDWYNLESRDADMRGTYVVHANGTIDLKYAGPVRVVGMTDREVEDAVLRAMVPRFYLPNVIQVTAVRIGPVANAQEAVESEVTVQGQVMAPGLYKLRASQMTLNRALLAARGFTRLAGPEIEIRRRVDGQVVRISVTRTQLENGEDPALFPSDEVFVKQAEKGSDTKPGTPVDVTVRSAPALSGTYIVQADGSLVRKGQEPAPPAPQVPALVFFVNGTVKAPGRYEWSEGMTVAQAIALAGGLTPTGKLGHIMRPEKDKDGKVLKYRKIKSLKDSTPILPGDELVTARKWFG